LDWDEERLDTLSANEQRKLIAAIDDLRERGGLKLIEGKEEFTLMREDSSWRLVFDWSSGIRIVFGTVVPQGKVIEARPTIKETVVQPEELFTVQYRVKNMTDQELFTRISHHVEPAALASHLDLVECALLLPVRIPPGEERSYSSTYIVRPDLPDGTKRLNVTYEFKLER
jgi:cytochrome c oxidase assembly protein Cox11